MKRALRRMLKACWLLAVIGSTFLLILAAVLWVESYTFGIAAMHSSGYDDQPSITVQSWAINIDSIGGRFRLQVYPVTDRSWLDFNRSHVVDQFVYTDRSHFPLWSANRYFGARDHYWILLGAYGPIALAAAVFPAVQCLIHLEKRQLRRHTSEGFCPTCGYDLRATPNRCPECGTTVSAPFRMMEPKA